MTKKSYLRVIQQLLMPIENKDFRTFKKTQGYMAVVSLHFEGQGKKKNIKPKKPQTNKDTWES